MDYHSSALIGYAYVSIFKLLTPFFAIDADKTNAAAIRVSEKVKNNWGGRDFKGKSRKGP